MKRQSGFTLMELMVTMVIAVILLTVVVPGFRDVLQNNRATAMANDFVSAVNFARSEAVKRVRQVRISAVNPATATNEWGPGWRIWADANDNDAFDAGEELRVRAALEGGATFDSVENDSEIRFLATGLTDIPAAQVRSFALRLPGCRGDQGRTIAATPTGYVSVARVSCS